MDELFRRKLLNMSTEVGDSIKRQAEYERVFKEKIKNISSDLDNNFTAQDRMAIKPLFRFIRSDLPIVHVLYYLQGQLDDKGNKVRDDFINNNKPKIIRALNRALKDIDDLFKLQKKLYESKDLPIEDTLTRYCGIGYLKQEIGNIRNYFSKLKM